MSVEYVRSEKFMATGNGLHCGPDDKAMCRKKPWEKIRLEQATYVIKASKSLYGNFLVPAKYSTVQYAKTAWDPLLLRTVKRVSSCVINYL